MNDDRFNREEELFQAALEIAPAGRSAFLKKACGGDDELRARVEGLIRWDGRDTAEAGLEAADPVGLDEQPGTTFGPYRIVELIGEGGFGAVYRAEQERPVRRMVALKIIKLGMDTKQVIARFEAERQALAMMDHPHIARVFDAGATHTGRPYFVMELVEGVPVTAYCDGHQLGLEDRLELFMLICDAVQHAHQKGIIHRDLKPSNVLVAGNGTPAPPTPKVIDFGIAKATSARLTERTLFTETGQLVGTPAYMSPEQAETGGQDIDTRSDIYSLGVLLYELLTGTTPFDTQTIRRLAYPEIQRIIRETDPPTPSTRVSGLGEDLGEVARQRSLDPGSLPRLLRGDLDWIVMKALEKNRTLRYGTASDLAGDIGRHLRHEPLLAGPPSAAYRMRKFIRRHRVGVAAGTLVALALLIGFGGTTWGLVRALRAEAKALRAEASALDDEETATQVSDFLVGLFRAPHPAVADGDAITARQILDQGVATIANLQLNPLVRAQLLETMSMTYRGLGLYDDARPMMDQALAIRRAEVGDDHDLVAESLYRLGWINKTSGHREAARRQLEESIEIYERLHGADCWQTVNVRRELAATLSAAGEYKASRSLYERVIEAYKERFGPEYQIPGWMLTQYGTLLGRMGDYETARAMLERALPLVEASSRKDSNTVSYVLGSLAMVLRELGDYEGARPLHERIRAIRDRAYGPDHPHTAWAWNDLARLLTLTGEYEEAQALFERSLAVFDAAGHEDLARAINDYGRLLVTIGDFQRASLLYERALEIFEQDFEPEHPHLATAYHGLAVLHREQGRYELAESFFERALDIREARFDPDHPYIAKTLHELAILYYDQGRFDEAKTLFERALAIREAKLPPDHPDLIETLDELQRLRAGLSAP